MKKLSANSIAYIKATAIGHIARQSLQTESSAKIWGHTSRGTFAVTNNKGILFISSQMHKGPLTINISGNIPEISICNDEIQLQLTPTLIRCPQIGFEIGIELHTPIWYPTLANKSQLNLELLFQRSKLLGDQMNCLYSIKRSKFSLSNNETSYHNDSRIGNYLSLSNNLLIALSLKDETAISTSLTRFLGYGEGLTPSGDDFICGFLLAVHSWQGILFPHLNFQNIIQKIVTSGWEKTSTLSANLITCAAIGSADERIIKCLQWLNGIENSTRFTLEELLSYGSSSGADALAGILTFIQSSEAFSY